MALGLFQGRIIDTSVNLDTIVVDRTSSNRTHRLGFKPHVIPELSLVKAEGQKFKVRPLVGWSKISKKIKEAAKQGLVIKFEQFEGQMTPDRKAFALNLKFSLRSSI